MTTDTETTTTTETPASSSTTADTTTPADKSATSQNSDGKTTETPGGETTTETPWQDSLPDDMKTDPHLRRYKTVPELAKAFREQVKRQGVPPERQLVIPTKPASEAPDDWKPIHAALGVPDDPSGYKIELDPAAAADAPALADKLREWGVKNNVQAAQMQGTIDLLNELGKEAEAAETAAAEAAAVETEKALKEAWGGKFDTYKREIGKTIVDAAKANGIEADDAVAALEAEVGNNTVLARVFAHMLDRMAEPGAPEGEGGRTVSDRGMTPAQAQSAIDALHADAEKMKALNDAKHPQHKAVLAERARLFELRRGEQKAA